ncbi:NUDIX domain-containing protein [Alkalibacillus haloalkaliphilus]|uniref:DNA mismatch repair protein MutT n=1 Tax=Alkalibacillus haloalkaliphilus TaxID=94136 RepID=A0A511W8J4_9BACI|nr:NUDIX domain-containing protein [Alkalibacillus haloalkaliphilus]GEN46363.1 DNA mismatch repair protein MutT [Alkalibacillus haloalkaliphilus]
MSTHIRVRAGAIIIEDESILLVEFNDETGVHFNFPAGGVEPNESVVEAVKREAMEEASVDVDVGSLAFTYEYAPHLCNYRFGELHQVGMFFNCSIKEGSFPKLPKDPDPYQTDVKWIPLKDLHKISLFPNMKQQLLSYVNDPSRVAFIEERLLEKKNVY